jgi:hypothetical protein
MSEKTKGIVLAVLVEIAAVVWYISSKESTTVVNGPSNLGYSYRPLAVDNPELQREKLKRSRETEYKSGGRDLFSMVALPPPEEVTHSLPKCADRRFC